MKQTTACGILHSQEYWISIDFLESCLHIFRNLISYWTIKRKGKNIEHIFQVTTHEGSYFSYLTIFWRKKLYYETIAFLCSAEFSLFGAKCFVMKCVKIGQNRAENEGIGAILFFFFISVRYLCVFWVKIWLERCLYEQNLKSSRWFLCGTFSYF